MLVHSQSFEAEEAKRIRDKPQIPCTLVASIRFDGIDPNATSTVACRVYRCALHTTELQSGCLHTESAHPGWRMFAYHRAPPSAQAQGDSSKASSSNRATPPAQEQQAHKRWSVAKWRKRRGSGGEVGKPSISRLDAMASSPRGSKSLNSFSRVSSAPAGSPIWSRGRGAKAIKHIAPAPGSAPDIILEPKPILNGAAEQEPDDDVMPPSVTSLRESLERTSPKAVGSSGTPPASDGGQTPAPETCAASRDVGSAPMGCRLDLHSLSISGSTPAATDAAEPVDNQQRGGGAPGAAEESVDSGLLATLLQMQSSHEAARVRQPQRTPSGGLALAWCGLRLRFRAASTQHPAIARGQHALLSVPP